MLSWGGSLGPEFPGGIPLPCLAFTCAQTVLLATLPHRSSEVLVTLNLVSPGNSDLEPLGPTVLSSGGSINHLVLQWLASVQPIPSGCSW